MVTGLQIISIVQSVLIILFQIILIHSIFKKNYNPKFIFFLAFGIISSYLSNLLEIALFNEYLISQLSIIVFLSPIIEETSKLIFLFYVKESNLIENQNDFHFYAVMLGFGFGLSELFAYTIFFGTEILVVRAILLPFNHPLLCLLLAKGLKFNENKLSDLLAFTGLTLILHFMWNLVLAINEQYIILNILCHSLIWYYYIRRMHQPANNTVSESP